MKKILITFSVAIFMCLSVIPSQALVGMPDAVPGTHLIQPFFLVPIPGADPPGTDNTLMTLTEVKGLGDGKKNPKGNMHWTIWNRNSQHMANGDVKYTKYDVIVLNASDLVLSVCSPDALTSLEVDLNGDGLNEYYMGYITYENNQLGADNFIGHMYVVDMPTGRASGAIIPAREYAPRATDHDGNRVGTLDPETFWPMQNSYVDTTWLPLPPAVIPGPNFTDYEVFTAAALAYSKDREHSAQNADWELPTWFRLLPRYYLKDGTGETFFFIWTSGNWGEFFDNGLFEPDQYNVIVNVYDEDENCLSGFINLPYELNFINVRNSIPSSWLGLARGGWFDIRWDIRCMNTWDPDWQFPWGYDAVPLAAEWLGYSYQYAFSPDKSLNWNVLYPMHRDVDELVHIRDICP